MGAYMKDGVRKTDLILVYNSSETKAKKAVRQQYYDEKRQFFQKNLIRSGLELEIESVEDDRRHHTLTFVKIHTPWQTLCKYAEHLQIKTPLWVTDRPIIKRRKIFEPDDNEELGEISEKTEKRKQQRLIKQPINVPFRERHLDRYAIRDKATYFTDLQRIEIAYEILQITPNNPQEPKKRGIENLLEEGVYESVYPLHDGDIESETAHTEKGRISEQDNKTAVRRSQRLFLRESWASWKNIGRAQPLTAIRNYFGEKVGFYFALMEMYINMLIFPSIVGLIIFLIGIITTAYNPEHENLCFSSDNDTDEPDPLAGFGLPPYESNYIANYWLCPICKPPACKPWHMGSVGCSYYGWMFRVDNPWNFLMSAITVVWATVFLKRWKRREYVLSIEWDSHDADNEDKVVRPAYEAKATRERPNPITREMEPYIPLKNKCLWMSQSIIATGLFLFFACAMVILLVICRIFLYGWLKDAPGIFGRYHIDFARWLSHGLLFVLVTGLEKLYQKVAHALTNRECPKTEKMYMNSLLWKMFIFVLLNDLIPIGYTAWVKGRTTGTPLDLSSVDELCDGGCMEEVTELVAVLLMIRLIVTNGFEIAIPLLKRCCERVRRSQKRDNEENIKRKKPDRSTFQSCTTKTTTRPTESPATRVRTALFYRIGQCAKDYYLDKHSHDGVYEELMDMTIQFAFIVLFVPALPVAPLVCLLNNVIEIRVDAMNKINANRRPLPLHTAGLGVWNRFFEIVNKLGVLSNAALLAFTSDNVPYFYYRFIYRPGFGYVGFIKFTLSKIYTEHFDNDAQQVFQENNISECWYTGYRQDYRPFDATELYWQITAFRMLVFSLYCLVFFIFIWVVNTFVSDEPASVKTKIQRQQFIVKKSLEAETEFKRKHILKNMANQRKHRLSRRDTLE